MNTKGLNQATTSMPVAGPGAETAAGPPSSGLSGTTTDGAVRLSAQGLTKTYGSIQALSDVSFELLPGEIMALLGENGAGKSTFVKVLAGLVDPDEGTIELEGVPTGLFPSGRSQDAGVAVVHQEFSSVRSLSIAENLILGERSARRFWTASQLTAHARPLLESVGLEYLDPLTPVERLSVAETQLVEIARVIARDAQIVIFDEPTAALSDNEIDRVLELIRRLADQGRSIIYVTHRLPEVFKLADRVTVFRNGCSAPPVPTADLDVGKVVAMMLGREMSTMFPDRGTKTDEPVLSVEGLQTPGLSAPVSFTAHRGEIVGLTGQIGSGSTAVIRAIAGLMPVVVGDVAVEGEALDLRGRQRGIRRGVAYCSPDRKADGMFGERSIRENLSAPWLDRVARFGWVSRSRERERAQSIAATFAIDVTRMNSPVMTLSGGNQQKVVLGKWLGTDPKILLVEEPTRGVDVGARAEVYHRLRELCGEGMTVIVVSSDTEEVLGLCDTIATFYHGRLQSSRPHDEWNEHDLTREVMHSEAIV